ncbi:MAG: cell division protein FtsZ [Candidatus Saccharibacteria bacterium]|jgi:cell division protein FtsZ|nr:cell division protein FtsZ [Candidatus Saccharibacteria bacterium]
MPEVKPSEVESTASIKVIGVGGAGGSAVNRMRDAGLTGVEFIAMNTDAQALHNSKADVKVHLGHETTNGLGAGADPTVGERAGDESREEIKNALAGADMAFITFGAGGGTGSGAGYIVAEEARKQDILTVGVVTKPFSFEGSKRKANADWAIERLARNVDALITIPNDRLLQTIDQRTPILETFKIADEVLRQGVQGISELITEHSLINLDFADVKAIMKDAGSALMGIGRASGENRASIAAQQAIESPLIEVSIDGARGVLFSIAGGYDVTMSEMQEAAELITASVSPDANIIWGASVRPELEDEIIVTVVATGFDSQYYRDDPRAQEVFQQTEIRASEPSQAMADPVANAPVEEEPKVEEAKAASDFADATTVNMWDSIRTDNGGEDDNSDIPAILRRRKKNKD